MIEKSGCDKRLHFHNAVMRWKSSLLTKEKKLELQAWIEEELERRWGDIRQPWKAFQTGGVDELTAENQYVQW